MRRKLSLAFFAVSDHLQKFCPQNSVAAPTYMYIIIRSEQSVKGFSVKGFSVKFSGLMVRALAMYAKGCGFESCLGPIFSDYVNRSLRLRSLMNGSSTPLFPRKGAWSADSVRTKEWAGPQP